MSIDTPARVGEKSPGASGEGPAPGSGPMPEPRAAQPQHAPHICAVSVVAAGTQMDIVLPASVPVAALVPELVGLVMSRRPGIAPPPAPEDRDGGWILGRIGRPALDPESSLVEQGIRDGMLLHLQPQTTQNPAPLFDDVVDALAADGAGRFPQWDRAAARRAGSVAAVCTSVAASALLMLPLVHAAAAFAPAAVHGHAASSDSPAVPALAAVSNIAVEPEVAGGRLVCALIAAVCALLCTVACPILARVYRDSGAASVAAYCALPFAFAAGAAMPAAHLGAPGVLLGSALATVCAVMCLRSARTGARTLTAVATAGILFGGTAGATSLISAPMPAQGAGLLLAGAAACTLAPRLTVILSRLPLPPVPSRDVQADLSGDADAAAAASALVPGAAARSGDYLAGIISGAVAAAVAGSAAAALPVSGAVPPTPSTSWPAVALALAAAAVMVLRGRALADRAPASALVVGGSLCAIATIATLAWTRSLGGTPIYAAAGGALLACGAALALFCGFAVPGRAFSPVLRRTLELIETTLTAALLPLALWAMGAYAAMRAL